MCSVVNGALGDYGDAIYQTMCQETVVPLLGTGDDKALALII